MALDEKKKAERQAAKKFLRKYLGGALPVDVNNPEAVKEFFRQIMAAVEICIGSGVPGGRTPQNSTLGKLLSLFGSRDTVDELELFKLTRMGRAEMRKRSKELIRDVAPESRIWVAFDANTEAWVVKGRGENEPENWNGYKLNK